MKLDRILTLASKIRRRGSNKWIDARATTYTWEEVIANDWDYEGDLEGPMFKIIDLAWYESHYSPFSDRREKINYLVWRHLVEQAAIRFRYRRNLTDPQLPITLSQMLEVLPVSKSSLRRILSWLEDRDLIEILQSRPNLVIEIKNFNKLDDMYACLGVNPYNQIKIDVEHAARSAASIPSQVRPT